MKPENKLIVLVEDGTDIRDLLSCILEKEGYLVKALATGEEALDYLETAKPAGILLDIMLSGVDGFEVCRRIRQREHLTDTPVLMMTARDSEPDEIMGLEIGADDYIKKPFSERVLILRLANAIENRNKSLNARAETRNVVHMGNLFIDYDRHCVKVGRKETELTKSEFRLLQTLVTRAGVVFSRKNLLQSAGLDGLVTERAIDVSIVGLRRKLGASSAMIKTVRGVGYRLDLP